MADLSVVENIDRMIVNNNRVVYNMVEQARLDGIIEGLEAVRELLVGPRESDRRS